MKTLQKIFFCYILRQHDYSSNALRGTFTELKEGYSQTDVRNAIMIDATMSCTRCGHEYPPSVKFRNEFLSKLP